MKLKIDKKLKIQLLQALAKGELDTDLFPELRGFEPARVLSKSEARELWGDLENGKFQNIISSHEKNL